MLTLLPTTAMLLKYTWVWNFENRAPASACKWTCTVHAQPAVMMTFDAGCLEGRCVSILKRKSINDTVIWQSKIKGNNTVGYTTETRTLWVTWRDQEHCGLHDGIKNTVSYATRSRALWVTRWEQEQCRLHDAIKSTVGYRTGSTTLWVKRWKQGPCGLHDGNKNSVGNTMRSRALWVTRWDQEHCGLHDGNKNTVGYTMGTRTLWVTRWDQKHCGLHDGNKNTVSYTRGIRKCPCTTGICFVVGSVNQQNVWVQPDSRPRKNQRPTDYEKVFQSAHNTIMG